MLFRPGCFKTLWMMLEAVSNMIIQGHLWPAILRWWRHTLVFWFLAPLRCAQLQSSSVLCFARLGRDDFVCMYSASQGQFPKDVNSTMLDSFSPRPMWFWRWKAWGAWNISILSFWLLHGTSPGLSLGLCIFLMGVPDRTRKLQWLLKPKLHATRLPKVLVFALLNRSLQDCHASAMFPHLPGEGC